MTVRDVGKGWDSMFKELLAKEPVNTSRQREIDLIKAFTILTMVVCHCIEELYKSYQGDLIADIIIGYENQLVGAQAFMIGMGIGIVYSRNSNPKTLARRGASLLIVGQVLNLTRFVLPNLLGYALTGDVFYRKAVFLVFSSDIMQFAGLTFLLLALLRHLKLSEMKIFLISIVMNIVGTMLVFKVNTGSYILDQFFAFFVATSAESYFPLFHWFIFPAFGMAFGTILKRVKDKKKFYTTLLIPTGIYTVFYIYVASCIDQPFFLVLHELEAFNRMNITDALSQLVCNTFLIGICFFITGILSDGINKGISFISGNINRFYCVQWVLVGWVEFVLRLIGYEVTQGFVCYSIAIVLILLTWTIVSIYANRLAKQCAEFIGKRRPLLYGLVVAASVVTCAWAYGAGLPMPNMSNDYLK